MRSDRVLTNLVCSQNCTYCNSRSSQDDVLFIQPEAVRKRIDNVIAAGAREVVLTGGEPTLRRDLTDLVTHACRRGAERVVLETNATLIDTTQAQVLKAAGLTLARVNVSGLIAPADRVTRDIGGAAATTAGLRALVGGGLDVECDAAIVQSTIAGIPDLPVTLHDILAGSPQLKGLILRVPSDSPNPEELVEYQAAAHAIGLAETKARSVGLRLKLAPDSGPPPCVFANPIRVAHLYSLTPGATLRADHVQVDACRSCQLSDRCSGLPRSYVARAPLPAMRPIEDDRLRRRLSLIGSVAEQMQREFVSDSRFHTDTGPVEEKIIRINFQCNQACRFCFVSTHLPAVPDKQTRQTIEQAARAGYRITLSGGEPTLNPHLLDYIRLARQHSRHTVCLQTNATRFGHRAVVNDLVDAGLGEVFVSLHGSTAEISDAITETPGTFVQTVAGIDRLSQSTLLLILNFVICQKNFRDLVPYVRLVAARWPKAIVNISFVAPSSDVVPKETSLIPRYSDVLPALTLALEEARRLGVRVVGFESMCGLPLCLVPAAMNRFFSLSDVPPGFDAGEFVKPRACASCSLQSKCYGLRRGYLALHGDGELKPVPSMPAEPLSAAY